MNLNIKNKNYSLDDLARDIAREVVLSPFVLSDDDMRAALRGIPSKELTIFVDRVKYHIPDFGNVSDHFVCQTLDHWLSGVRTKEDLKLGSPSVSLEGESFPCDRGKYFILADGRIEKCEKAKREFEWPGVSFFFELPPEIKVETVTEKGKNPIITMTCCDKQILGQAAAKIRSLRKPEPYKGKGIRFQGEEIRKKAGKAAAK